MEEVLKKFMDQMNKRFDLIDKEIKETRSDIKDLTTTQAEMRTDIQNLSANQAEMRTDIQNLSANQAEMRTDIRNLSANQAEMRTDIRNLSATQAEMKLEITEMKLDITEMKLDIKELKVGQEKLKDNLINGLGPYFEKITEHIDAKTDELRDTLEDQQRVIDILSARSIRHEGELRDIKRIVKNQ